MNSTLRKSLGNDDDIDADGDRDVVGDDDDGDAKDDDYGHGHGDVVGDDDGDFDGCLQTSIATIISLMIVTSSPCKLIKKR